MKSHLICYLSDRIPRLTVLSHLPGLPRERGPRLPRHRGTLGVEQLELIREE